MKPPVRWVERRLRLGCSLGPEVLESLVWGLPGPVGAKAEPLRTQGPRNLRTNHGGPAPRAITARHHPKTATGSPPARTPFQGLPAPETMEPTAWNGGLGSARHRPGPTRPAATRVRGRGPRALGSRWL